MSKVLLKADVGNLMVLPLSSVAKFSLTSTTLRVTQKFVILFVSVVGIAVSGVGTLGPTTRATIVPCVIGASFSAPPRVPVKISKHATLNILTQVPVFII